MTKREEINDGDLFCDINAQCQDEYGNIPCDDGYDCEHLKKHPRTKGGAR